MGREFMGVEYYTLAVGERGPAGEVNGWEADLFAGLGEETP
jgi:N-acetyl-1-D-myo-inositol-2-amino-2-deoxy-alpha-D-glucopyranoside deacetylase